MATFGETITNDAVSEETPQAVNGEDKQPAIDPNDPRLTSEVLAHDPDADAYAQLPTLPDGRWRAKAKQVDIKDSNGVMQQYAIFSRAKMDNGRPFFATNVEYSIIDHSGDFDGIKLTEYWVKTLVDQRKGTSQANTLIGKLGGQPLSNATQKAVIEKLRSTLASEPELILETAWEASCQHCQEVAKKKGEKSPRPFLTGMHRFPATKVPGVHEPIVKCPTCSQQVKAQPRIVAPFSLKEAAATRGTGAAK